MLHVVLLILKIIGMILLAILGLLLAVLLIILFVPVRYRAQGSRRDGKLEGEAAVSWLLHIFSLKLSYQEKLQVTFRVFGIPVRSRDDGAEAEFETGTENETDVGTETGTEAGIGEKTVRERDSADEPGEESEEEAETEPEMEPEILTVQSLPEDEPADPNRLNRKHRRRKKRKSLPVRISEKVRFSFQKICDTLKNIKEKEAQRKAMWDDPENRELVKLIWRQLKRLLRHIRPTKLKGSVTFGFDDPSQTGQVLMYISPFYGWYGKNISICPSFDREVLEGELALKGRIRVASLLMIAFTLVRNRRFRTLLKRFMG